MFKLVLALQLVTTYNSVLVCGFQDSPHRKEENTAKRIDMVERFMGDGIESWEIEDDIRMYANMFKWRYTNLMPT